MPSKRKKSGDGAKRGSRSHRSGSKRRHRSKDHPSRTDALVADTSPSVGFSRLEASTYPNSGAARASSTMMPSLHTSTRIADVATTQSRRRSGVRRAEEESVAIPCRLLPGEVPEPLRSTERGGKASSCSRVPCSRDDLYSRWRHAYTFGTAVSEDYGCTGPTAKNVLVRQPRVETASPGPEEMTAMPRLQREAAVKCAAAPPLPSQEAPAAVVVRSTLPERAPPPDCDSMEEWIDRAGYFLVPGCCVDSSDSSQVATTQSEAKAAAPRGAPPQTAATPPQSAVASAPSSPPASSLRQSLPPSVTRFLADNSQQPSSESVVAPTTPTTSTAPTPPPTSHETGSMCQLSRMWTPSPGPQEQEEYGFGAEGAMPPMQERYSMFAHGSAAASSLTDVRSATRSAAAAIPSWSSSPREGQMVSSLAALRGLPSMQDGLAPDPDLADNDSRHLVSVSRLPGAANEASRSEGSLRLADEASEREMGSEVLDEFSGWDSMDCSERRRRGVGAPAADDGEGVEDGNSQSRPQPRRRQTHHTACSSKRAVQESSFLTMSNSRDIGTRPASSPAPPPQQQQQRRLSGVAASQYSDTARLAWAASQKRFRRAGHSAAVIGAQRVLTLLLLDKPVTPPTVTKNETEVRLPALSVPGTTRSTATTTKVVVDEAVAVVDSDVCLRSSLLREVAEEVCAGHCAAVLLSVAPSCGSVGSRAVESTLGLLLAAVTKREAQESGTGTLYYFKMEASIARVHKGTYIADLIASGDEELGTLAPARVIANPLLGCWLDKTLLWSVRSDSQLKTLLRPVETWLAKTPTPMETEKEFVCIYVALRQATHPSGSAGAASPTLALSSLLLYVSRAEDGAVGVLHNRAAATPLQRSLLRRVGDGAFTVAVSCVGRSDERAGSFASKCADASTVKNSALVSGDVGRYMTTIREATAKDVRDGAATFDSSSQLRAEQRPNLRTDLLRRLTCLMEDPVNCTIPFYPDRIAAKEEEEAAAAAASRVSRSGGSTTGPTDTTSARSMSSGMLLQSVPTSGQTIRMSSVAEALEMFADCRVCTVAIHSTKKACGYEVVSGTANALVRLSDRATFVVDELRQRRLLPTLHPFSISTHTSALCSLFASGYNAALVSFDGRSDNVFASPVWYVVAEAIDRALNRTDVQYSEVRIAFSVVKGNGEAMDLLEPGAVMVPLLVASSPLFGTAVHTSRLHRVLASHTLRELLYRVAPAAASVWTSNAFLHVLLVHVFRTDSDVAVSSLHLSVLGSHAELCQGILANGREGGEGEGAVGAALHPGVLRLHYGFLSGPAASVFLVSLNDVDDANAAMAMTTQQVPLLRKSPGRSGSVQQFVWRTRNRLKKRRRKAQTLSGAERQYLAKMEWRVTEMLDDAAALLDPATAGFPKAYLSEQVAPVAERERRCSAAATAALPDALPASADPHRSPAEKERALLADSSESGASISPRATCFVKGSAAEEAADSALAAPVGVSRPRWLLGLELGGSAATAVQVSGAELEWAPTKERFDTDGIFFYKSALASMRYLFTENCEALQRLREDACAAQSCAILGLVDGAGSAEMHVRTQPLWRSFTALVLNSAFQANSAGSTWLEGSELHLRMCAVQNRTVLYDFLLDTEDEFSSGLGDGGLPPLPARVALAVNPLFGPVVRNTTVMRAGNIRECQCVIRSGLDALNALADEYPSGTVVLASVVLKNVTADDIWFSSITAMGVRVGKDLPALRDILAMDPKGGAPPSLYRYALRGPSHLLCLTTLDSAAREHCVEALRLSQGIHYATALAVPTGSLRICLQEKRSVLANHPMTEQARANTESVVRQLAEMLENPFAPIVIFPFDEDPAPSADRHPTQENTRAPGGAQSTTAPAASPRVVGGSGAGGSCCRCTAVITSTNRGAIATLDARTETNTVHLAQASYPFSEVVLRVNNSAVVRPILISSVVQRVQQGFNAALIVADGVNSTAGAALLSKLVSLFIRNTGDNGHGVSTALFTSITAVRFPSGGGLCTDGAMVKDLFSAEPQFYPLQVARSPFFGSCLDGARFSSLNRIDDVCLTLKDAQQACNYLKVTLVVTMVLKQVTRATNGAVQDVLMSSLFSVINTAEACSGRHACAVFDDMLDQREAALEAPSADDARVAAWRSCLLAQAFGGDCFTYGVVGVAADADRAEAGAMLKFGARLMQVPCRVPVKSSAVEVLEHARRRLREGPTPRGDSRSDSPFSMHWDWQGIAAEAEEMLKTPDTCKPRAYLCE